VVYQRDPVPHQPKVGICGETGRHRFRHVMDCLIWCTELQARTTKKSRNPLHGRSSVQDWWRLSCLLHTSAKTNSISQSLPATTFQVSCLLLFLISVTLRQLEAQWLSSNAGECWPAAPGGGPQGSLPPHVFSLYFKEGGVGTFLPLYFRFVDIARDNLHQVQQQPSAPQELVATA